MEIYEHEVFGNARRVSERDTNGVEESLSNK